MTLSSTFWRIFCIVKTVLGLDSSPRNLSPDWRTLVRFVAANPETANAKRIVRDAVKSHNWDFLDQLRQEEERVANTASYRIRQSMKDKWEARAFLAGSPAQWGWEVDEDAENTALVGGIEDAMSGSIFESRVSNNNLETAPLDPATLRDIYLDTYQAARKALVWTVQPSSKGPYTWFLTPSLRSRRSSILSVQASRTNLASSSSTGAGRPESVAQPLQQESRSVAGPSSPPRRRQTPPTATVYPLQSLRSTTQEPTSVQRSSIPRLAPRRYTSPDDKSSRRILRPRLNIMTNSQPTISEKSPSTTQVSIPQALAPPHGLHRPPSVASLKRPVSRLRSSYTPHQHPPLPRRSTIAEVTPAKRKVTQSDVRLEAVPAM